MYAAGQLAFCAVTAASCVNEQKRIWRGNNMCAEGLAFMTHTSARLFFLPSADALQHLFEIQVRKVQLPPTLFVMILVMVCATDMCHTCSALVGYGTTISSTHESN